MLSSFWGSTLVNGVDSEGRLAAEDVSIAWLSQSFYVGDGTTLGEKKI